MKRIRMGVIGCGEIAQIMHLPFLTELRDLFEVRSVCDISPALAAAVGDAFGVPHHCADYAELLARDDVDAVAVLTADHAPVAIAAAEAGKHIFVEKPMCYTVEEGRAMIAAAERAGVTLMVGYMKRYDPGYEYALQVFESMAGVRLIRIHDLTGRGPLAPYRACPVEARARRADPRRRCPLRALAFISLPGLCGSRRMLPAPGGRAAERPARGSARPHGRRDRGSRSPRWSRRPVQRRGA